MLISWLQKLTNNLNACSICWLLQNSIFLLLNGSDKIYFYYYISFYVLILYLNTFKPWYRKYPIVNYRNQTLSSLQVLRCVFIWPSVLRPCLYHTSVHVKLFCKWVAQYQPHKCCAAIMIVLCAQTNIPSQHSLW